MRISLARRVLLTGLAVQLAILPVVTWVILSVTREIQIDNFLQHSRTLARGIADSFEAVPGWDDPRETSRLLDSVILTGEGSYAELVDNGHSTRSALNRPGLFYPGRQDLGFGEHPDSNYFIVLPVVKAGHQAEVRLAFDKRPVWDAIEGVRRRILQVLLAYALSLLIVALASVRYLTRTFASLGQVARDIASGQHQQQLSANTPIPELNELVADLEKMRAELVGVNAELRDEIARREQIEEQRRDLEAQLRRRQRLETVGRLAAGVAHEINNILLPIMLFSQSVLEGLPADSPVRNEALGIQRSARRGKDVVNKVLAFSRNLTADKPGVVHLAESVREAMSFLLVLAPANIAIEKDFAGASMPVMGDETLINLLTVNLCTNALQAMRGTGGTLSVKLALVTATGGEHPGVVAGQYMELRVRDTGHGMDDTTLKRMFEPFFTTASPGDGTGLGLAIVKSIAETLRATLLVDSTPGVGTEFRVLFPVADAPPGAVPRIEAQS